MNQFLLDVGFSLNATNIIMGVIEQLLDNPKAFFISIPVYLIALLIVRYSIYDILVSKYKVNGNVLGSLIILTALCGFLNEKYKMEKLTVDLSQEGQMKHMYRTNISSLNYNDIYSDILKFKTLLDDSKRELAYGSEASLFNYMTPEYSKKDLRHMQQIYMQIMKDEKLQVFEYRYIKREFNNLRLKYHKLTKGVNHG